MIDSKDILVIENNFVTRSTILQRFKECQLKHTIQFVKDCKEALMELYFFNKEIDSGLLPKLILINPENVNEDFFEKLSTDKRYRQMKIFILIDDSQGQAKAKINKYRINGYVEKNLDFKNHSGSTFLDTIELFLEILRIKTRIKH